MIYNELKMTEINFITSLDLEKMKNNLDNLNIDQMKVLVNGFIQHHIKVKTTNKKTAQKYYKKIYNAPEGLSQEELNKIDKVKQSRADYQKRYYQKKKDYVCERQKVYRIKQKKEEEERNTKHLQEQKVVALLSA